MTKNDWYDAGDEIIRLVQDAVDSKDFSQLSSTITNVVNDTVNGLQSAWKERDAYQYTNREAAERIRRNVQRRRQQAREMAGDQDGAKDQAPGSRAPSKDRTNAPVKVKLKVPGELSGRIMKWVGYSMSAMFGLSLSILLLVAFATDFPMVIPTGILAIFFGTSLCIGIKGSGRVKLADRFRRYKTVLGSRTYCLVEELSSAIGKNYKFVQKDLKKMIERGFFKEGYLARQETLLITDNSTYQQYLGTQTEYERRAMAEEQHKKNDSRKTDKDEQEDKGVNAKSQADLTPECREIIEEGRRYIRHIHECNEKIPGEEMSAKLDRLELVITRIFREAEKNPDAADDLKKMMSYYLPTTKKLLDAYCEMIDQPIAGQNIETTKKEIEDALDTINTAFENLLDSFFEEKAWDISSDISVLHTMLAQEGLTGTDFAQKQGGK
ncbi:MAG: 5-bromo-4-chloroindolyl phosphate hydrolysis family protein [Lachnospiraceae bacterium]|nr:5-bromo-4-chloroindolyl phosphate hydrolysis family protein [Lachnospiraceae bacterium]